MLKSKLIPFVVLLACSVFCLSWRFFAKDPLKEKVDEYLLSTDKEPDAKLIAELRKGEYKTVEWLYATYWKKELNYSSYRSNKKFLQLFDKVCGQKDAIASGLFWHTDLEEALNEAEEQKKPVLCLQMLGDLSQDFSCANSRFFRTLLYSNENVSKILKERYILCWESVIKVPKVTIEYPDGKKQVQTITGNSMHMILNSDGVILDALPGLYGPAFFEKWVAEMSDKNYVLNLKDNQKQRMKQLKNETLVNNLNNEDWSDILESYPEKDSKVSDKALEASALSVAKTTSEAPVYKGVFSVKKKAFKNLPASDPTEFTSYAAFGFQWENLPASTQKLISAKKNYSIEELKTTLQNISDNLTKENIRNDVRIHAAILQWLQKPSTASNKKEFVKKVYKELFLTPLDDPKMGLYDRSIYSGTTDDGFLEE